MTLPTLNRLALTGLMLLVIVMLLTGCAPQASGVKEDVRTTLADNADGRLAYHEWGVCDAPSAGALRRRYGDSSEKMQTWQVFCLMRHKHQAMQPNVFIPPQFRSGEAGTSRAPPTFQ